MVQTFLAIDPGPAVAALKLPRSQQQKPNIVVIMGDGDHRAPAGFARAAASRNLAPSLCVTLYERRALQLQCPSHGAMVG